MRKIIKKKVCQKKTVHEDEVKGFALEALDSLKERQKQLIIAGAAVFAVLAFYIMFSMYSSSIRADAAVIEMRANNYYYGKVVEGAMSDEERLKKALKIYKESVDIKATFTALYNLGNTYYKLGDFENAIKEYEAVIDKFGGNDEVIPLVYQKMASSYFMSGRNDKAFEVLEKLERINNGIFKDTALVLEARYLESTGDTEKSLAKYIELAAEFPSSPWSRETASKISSPKEETVEEVKE